MAKRMASIGGAGALLACLLTQGCSLAGIHHPPTTPAERRRYDCDGNVWLLAADALGLAFFGVLTGAALDDGSTHDATTVATVGPTLLLGTSLAHGLYADGVCRDFVAARTRHRGQEPPPLPAPPPVPTEAAATEAAAPAPSPPPDSPAEEPSSGTAASQRRPSPTVGDDATAPQAEPIEAPAADAPGTADAGVPGASDAATEAPPADWTSQGITP